MTPIKINFVDFWPGFNINDNFFTRLLAQDIEISDNPDFVICSVFGRNYLNYNCIRIQFIGENIRPDFQLYDYAFTFDHFENDRHMRLPLYVVTCNPATTLLKKPPYSPELFSRKFCSFVASNGDAKDRLRFLDRIDQYQTVDCGGPCRNNVGGRVPDKLAFLQNYKFNMAFENTSHPGYTTEKIFDAMAANTIPIYWGDPLVARDFNSKSFINVNDFPDFSSAVEYIAAVDQDPQLYKNIWDEPFLPYNQPTTYSDEAKILARFHEIFGRGQQKRRI